MVNIQGTLQARKQPLDGSDDQIKGRNGENPGHSDGAGRIREGNMSYYEKLKLGSFCHIDDR